MAKKSSKKSTEAVYKIVEVVGSSPTSFEDAARAAVEAISAAELLIVPAGALFALWVAAHLVRWVVL